MRHPPARRNGRRLKATPSWCAYSMSSAVPISSKLQSLLLSMGSMQQACCVLLRQTHEYTSAGVALLYIGGRHIYDHHSAQIPPAGVSTASFLRQCPEHIHCAVSEPHDHSGSSIWRYSATPFPSVDPRPCFCFKQDAEGSSKTHRKHLRIEMKALREQVLAEL